MITRFYVDNYKCLTNFEYKPKPFELVLGVNGTGKTTVFEALDRVRRFVVDKEDARQLFNSNFRTAWDRRYTQVFEVDVEAEGRTFQYRLEINLLSQASLVEKEVLRVNGQVFYESEWRDHEREPGLQEAFFVASDDGGFVNDHGGQARHLAMPGLAAGIAGLLPMPLANTNQTMLVGQGGLVLEDALTNFHLIKLNPPLMTSQVAKAQTRPTLNFSNFASYYLYLLQKKQGQVFELLPRLREAIAGFDQFSIEEDYDEARRFLQVGHRRPPSLTTSAHASTGPVGFDLDELSDGQRALIALYTLLYCTLEANTTLVIDEPENYVALSELQPWLSELRERVEEQGGQVILISHHPEFINEMAPQEAVQFQRDEGGPVRIVPFRTQGFEGLTPAEIVARGWASETTSGAIS